MRETNAIIDYATGKEMRQTPEEPYRQLFEHILIDDLGYPKEHIDIEFSIQRGSNRRAEQADIVVFNDEKHRQENAYIIIEVETSKKNYDLQALTYTTATPAPYCVWFAGFERQSDGPYYLYRDLANAPTQFQDIPTLPRYGETFETIGRYRKSDLQPAKDLRILFGRLHHKLYGSGPIKREENVAKEVIKLLFCKIIDELSPEELCEFRVTSTEIQYEEGLGIARERIEELYRQLQMDPDFYDMFADEKIEYDDYWVANIVSELQGIGLLHDETNTDAFGDAYEVFLPSTLKGESGQFFTPREVVRFAVAAIAPSFQKREFILDPACGSGGFLTITIEHIRRQVGYLYRERAFSEDRLKSIVRDYAGKYIHGIDIDPLLYRIAKSYMAIIGDGRSNIYLFDSLEPFDRYPERFTKKIKQGGVDIVMTNPPFGTKIDDIRPYVLEQFDLGHRLNDGIKMAELVNGQDPDKLFLERDLQFLKDPTADSVGGRMVIVLPRQNLSGSETTSIELRKWLLKNAKIQAIIDLPREAFQPHTGTKTSLVFLQKVANPETDYPIFMAVSEAVGHDRRGNLIYVKDERGQILFDENDRPVIWNDLPQILEKYEKFKLGSPVEQDLPSCFVINSDQIRSDHIHRLDAWYYDPNKNDIAKHMESAVGKEILDLERLGELTVDSGVFYPGRHKRNYVNPGPESLPFYSGTQILQVRPFDLKWQPKDYKPANNHVVEKDWILITRSGSTGRVIIVNDSLAGSMVSEHVIRVICDESRIDPYYVYAFLASAEIGKVLMEKGIYASVVDHLSPQFISSLPIPRLDPCKEKEIADSVRESEKHRSLANILFSQGVGSVESLILNEIKLIEDTPFSTP